MRSKHSVKASQILGAWWSTARRPADAELRRTSRAVRGLRVHRKSRDAVVGFGGEGWCSVKLGASHHTRAGGARLRIVGAAPVASPEEEARRHA